jgi:hypothetical protein
MGEFDQPDARSALTQEQKSPKFRGCGAVDIKQTRRRQVGTQRAARSSGFERVYITTNSGFFGLN